VFADVKPSMRIAQEEIFGPVLAILRWDDEKRMLDDVDAVPYGLTCSIWTNDLTTAHRAAMKVGAGYVWINEVGKHFLGAPFGGVKQSGLGREECLDELLRFTQEKNIHIGLGKAPRQPCPRASKRSSRSSSPPRLPHVEQDVVVRRARHGDRRRGSSADIVSAFPWSRSWRSPRDEQDLGQPRRAPDRLVESLGVIVLRPIALGRPRAA
jgi:hypothetical protein